MRMSVDRLRTGLLCGAIACGGGCAVPDSKSPASAAKAETASASVFAPGGFSVDFEKSQYAFAPPPAGAKDLLLNGGFEATDSSSLPDKWLPDAYVWLPDEGDTHHPNLLAKFKPWMKWATTTDASIAGSRSLSISIPSAAYDGVGGNTRGGEVCAYFHQTVPLPDSEGNALNGLLAFSYRGILLRNAQAGYTRAYARVTFIGGPSSQKYAQTMFYPDKEWRKGAISFLAPKGTQTLDIRLGLTGAGKAIFDEVSLQCWKKSKGASKGSDAEVRLMPASFLDNRYCLASGDPGTMIFGLNGDHSASKSLCLILQLPVGVALLSAPPNARILDMKKVHVDAGEREQYRIDITRWKNTQNPSYPFYQWGGVMLTLKTELPAGDVSYPCAYWLEDDAGRQQSSTFDLQLVPPIETVNSAKMFRSGGHWFLESAIASDTAAKEMAALYRRVGFNSTHISPCPLGDALGKAGVERYTQPFTNAYTFPGKKPADAVFRLKDGSPLETAICPSEVYLEGAYFTNEIKNGLFRNLLVKDRKAEQFMINWEPGQYVGQGCFCARCKEEFRKFSGLAAAELEAAWPGKIMEKHRDLWDRFRAWQNGRYMATLEKAVHAVGKEAGLDSHFIPEVHYELLTENAERQSICGEWNPNEYMGKLPLFVSWAPYTWYIYTQGPYIYYRGRHLAIHTTACDVQSFLSERLLPEEKPALIAFPYGTYEGATQPEAIAFEMTTYFLDGYRGAIVYLFPGGYDARWWRAIAGANRQIASFEPFVFNGKTTENHSLHCESPMPTMDPGAPETHYVYDSPRRKEWMASPLLISWEYEKDGQRLVAVGNFWERGEGFFRLSFSGLDADKTYVLREPLENRVYSGADGRMALKPDELGKGVLLHVGAMRHAFFVLEPYREGQAYGTVIRPETVETVRQQRLPALNALYSAEYPGKELVK